MTNNEYFNFYELTDSKGRPICSPRWFLRGMVQKDNYLYIFAGTHKSCPRIPLPNVISLMIVFNMNTKKWETIELDTDIHAINQVIDYK